MKNQNMKHILSALFLVKEANGGGIVFQLCDTLEDSQGITDSQRLGVKKRKRKGAEEILSVK